MANPFELSSAGADPRAARPNPDAPAAGARGGAAPAAHSEGARRRQREARRGSLPAASPPAPTTPEWWSENSLPPGLPQRLPSAAGTPPPSPCGRPAPTPFMDDIHPCTSSSHAASVKPASSNSTNRAQGPFGRWQQLRVLARLRVKLPSGCEHHGDSDLGAGSVLLTALACLIG